jgi:hypothetical protein
LESELLDDIVTDRNAHIPNLIVEARYKLTKDFIKGEKHDFVVFSVYEEF